MTPEARRQKTQKGKNGGSEKKRMGTRNRRLHCQEELEESRRQNRGGKGRWTSYQIQGPYDEESPKQPAMRSTDPAGGFKKERRGSFHRNRGSNP